MRSMIRTSAILATLLGLSATAGQAQSGYITATATVLTAITVTGCSTLAFGNVYPGHCQDGRRRGRRSVRPRRSASANVGISFTLPANLTGPGTLPIGTWTGYHNTTVSATTGGVASPMRRRDSTAFSGTGALFVFVGATVTPAAVQAAGSYSARSR